MRFATFALLLLGWLVACDSGVPSGGIEVEEVVETVYGLHGCVDSDSERVYEGELTLGRDAFALEVVHLRDGEADYVVAKDSGAVESHGPLRLLTLMGGDTLFAAVGPDPQDPTTVGLSGLPSCPVFSFAVEGSAPDLTLTGGERRSAFYTIVKIKYYDENTFYDLPLGECQRYGCRSFRGGSVQFSEDGSFDAEFLTRGDFGGPFDVGGYISKNDTTRVVGDYVASGPVVVLNPGTERAVFGFERGGTVDLNGGFMPSRSSFIFRHLDLRFQRQ